MSANLCRCGTPTGDAFACPTCLDRLAKALRKAPALVEDLDLTLSRQRRFSAGSDGSRPTERPLLFHIAASHATHQLRAALRIWVNFCHAHKVSHSDTTTPAPKLTRVATPAPTTPKPLPAVDRCDLSDLPVDQCACRRHMPAPNPSEDNA